MFWRKKVPIENAVPVKDTVPVKSYSLDNLYIAKSTIISSYCNDSYFSPICITWYYAVYEKNCKYYELFSDTMLDLYKDDTNSEISSRNFDTPYIEELELLKNFLKDPNQETIPASLVFAYITFKNSLSYAKAILSREEE